MASETSGSTGDAAEEDCEDLDWPECSEGETFALQVVGEQGVDPHILEGDHVLIKKQGYGEHGKVYCVRGDDGQPGLSRVYREGDRYRLESGSSGVNPVYRDKVEILGVLIGVVWKY